jgi:HSP20 family protein
MAISRYREYVPGFEGLARLNRLLDEAFASFPGFQPGGVITSAWLPPVDVSEDRDKLQLTLELPGVRPEDVKLSMENNILTIRGEKRQKTEETSGRVHRYERSYGSFERTFALPNTVDPDRIEANYENGVLTINIPKVERARPREIPVKGSTGGKAEIGTVKGASQPAQAREPEEEGSAGRTTSKR